MTRERGHKDVTDGPIRRFLMFPVSHHASGGCNIEGEDESWDFGTGAGFYVDSTEEPWKTNYRMYSYVSEEVGLMSSSTNTRIHVGVS